MPKLLGSALVALLLAPSAGAQGSAAVTEEDFVAWVREAAIPLESLDPGSADLAPLAALDPLLEGKRIVYLGEPDHLLPERLDYRLLLVRFLFARGWRHVGMEQGRADGRRIDRYLATGDEALLDRVAILGYDGDLREDRDDGVPGWTAGGDEELRRRALEDVRRFLRGLRRVSAERGDAAQRLTYFGYDVSMKPGGGYADARALLEPHRAAQPVAELLRRLARVPGESRLEEAARLEALVAVDGERDAELEARLGADGVRELRRTVACLAESLRFVDGLLAAQDPDGGEPAAGDPDARRTALARREEVMRRQVDEWLAELGPDAKVILLGHDLHLSRASADLAWEGRPMWPTIGTHVAERHPGQVFAFWLLYERGWRAVPGADPPLRRIRSRRSDLERLLARAGELFVLPLHGPGDPRRAFLDEPRDVLVGGYRARCVLPAQADAVVFLREASAPSGR